MYILGISAFYHDSAACLIKDGVIVAAAQEERFSRVKHDSAFPAAAIMYCLKAAGIESPQIAHVVFYEKPFLKFERLLETYLAFAPKGFQSFLKAMPTWLKHKLFQKSQLVKALTEIFGTSVDWSDRLLFSEHHLSHAASAFYPSPFDDAVVLTLDGVGEWTTTSIAVGEGASLEVIKEIHFPHSLGLLYSAFTYYTGFKVNSGEYKVMGLAPYGKPIYRDLIKKHLIKIAADGSFQLNMEFFNFATGLTMTNKKFHALFGGPPRSPESDITQKDMDLAASVQHVTEEVVMLLAKHAAEVTGKTNLCLAGGVALNCVANGKLHHSGVFKHIWVQPAAGDSGGALGAALAAWHLHFKRDRMSTDAPDHMQGGYLGPSFTDEQAAAALTAEGAVFLQLQSSELLDRVIDALVNHKAVGWMQGRMEFGPRALGARSILADPRSATMQRQLNLKIKYRESFRPFAPAVLREKVSDWFDFDSDSPYMLMVADVSKHQRLPILNAATESLGLDNLNTQRSTIPAVTHVDYSARIQTVTPATQGRFHDLIARFYDRTGCPILVNTSFNIRGEPIVCSPSDALRCFMGTELDLLVIGNLLLYKSEQPSHLLTQYRSEYQLD